MSFKKLKKYFKEIYFKKRFSIKENII